jgi:hypothetical protein
MSGDNWSEWRRFPDPTALGLITAPMGPGCYELRHGKQLVCFGTGKNVAYRMTSLLPKPVGAGTRNNAKKQQYVMQHLAQIEYRTCAFYTKGEAKMCEDTLKANGRAYLFPT